jgi:hypothetical protein
VTDDENDTVYNSGDIEADATTVGVAASISVVRKGVAGAVTLDPVSFDSGNVATSRVGAITTGAGNDEIVSDAVLTASADSTASSVGVAVSAKGISAAITTSEAHSRAIGIEAGTGDDTVQGAGEITADATSTAVAVSVAVSNKGLAIAGDMVWDGGTTADATAKGIHTGEGDDTIGNEAKIVVESIAVAPSIGVAVTGEGLSAATSTATSKAETVGIDAAEGNDQIYNTGDISATATSNADSITVAISGKGVAASANDLWDGGTESTATAKGIDTGSGNNIIANEGAIDTSATAVTASVGVSVVGKGVAAAASTSTADAESVGIDLGEGTESLANTGAITADALATAVAVNVAVTGKGVAGALDTVWDGGTTATAIAKGIEAGAVDNVIANEATITTDSVAVAASVGVSVSGKGVSAAITTATSVAESAGIDTGEGDDIVYNAGSIDADATANADAVTVAVSGQGVAGAANAVWDGGTTSMATAKGIDVGSGEDIVMNEAAVDASADAITVAASVAVVGKGVGVAASTSTANGEAVAIDMGDGAATVQNTGVLYAEATSVAVTANVAVAGQGVAGSADAVWDGGTKSLAVAKGIETADSEDTVVNEAKVEAESDAVTVSAGISVVGTGVGLATSTSSAVGESVGLDAGDGMDALLNTGEIVSDASATAVSASVSVAGTGVAGSADAVWDGGTKATATAMGIDAGNGNNTVTNAAKIDAETDATTVSAAISVAGTGVGLATSTSTAEADTVGIAAGSGMDMVVNTGEIILDGTATAVSAQVSVVGTGVAAASDAVWDGGTKATSIAKGLDTASGDDIISNAAKIDVETDAVTVSVAVSVAGTGVGVAMSTSTAKAESVGIDSGHGADTVENTEEIDADASSTAVSASVAVTGIGVSGAGGSVWDGGTKGYATSKAIDTGSESDTIENSGKLTAESSTTSTSVGVAITGKGVAFTTVTSTAEADAVAIDSGEGDDTIKNTAAITADAESDAVTVQVAVAGLGLAGAADSVWDNGTTSVATARGIYGDTGNDEIFSEGDISATSEADSVSVAVSMTLAGVAGTAATSTATTESNALDGGDGDDTIVSTGTLASTATSNADTVTVSIAGVGVALAADSVWDGGTTANATARGIYGGSGDDVMQSDGVINATADAETDSTAVTATLAGVAGTVVSSTATAEATGIDGGRGGDSIESLKTVNATAIADAASVQVSISGIGASISADSAWDGGTTAVARATGLAGGDDGDTLLSKAAINAASTATSDSTAVAVSLAGIASTTAVSTSTSAATGIDGGTGNDTMESTGAITAAATADADALSVSIAGVGVAAGDNPFWDHTTTATAVAQGLSGGEGVDTIINRQSILAVVDADAEATEVSVALVGVTFGDTATAAVGMGTGIAGGGGDDIIFNEGTIVVGGIPGTDGLMARAEADSVGVALVGAAIGDASATATVVSKGIDGGAGDDTVQNENAIQVFATSAADVAATTVGVLGSAGQEANAVASADGTGIAGGDGDDRLISLGTVGVLSTTTVTLDSAAFTFGGATNAKGSTTATTQATGIAGGDGEDGILSEAAITADAISTLTTSGNTTAVFGSAGSEMTSGAVTVSGGIDSGAGGDIIENLANIDVSSTAYLTMSTSSFTLGGAVSQDSTLAASNRVEAPPLSSEAPAGRPQAAH